MQANDPLPMRGEVTIELINEETGVIEETHQYNILTAAFKYAVAGAIAGQTVGTYMGIPSHIALGTGGPPEGTYDSANQNVNKVLKTTGADQRWAQKFGSGTWSSEIMYVALWMKRIGSSLGNIKVDVYSDSAGPLTLLGTSADVNADGLDTAYGWCVFTFPAALYLTASTNYWLVLRADTYAYSAAVKEIIWGADNTSPPANQMMTWNGTTWSADAATACFATVRANGATSGALAGETLRKVLTSSAAVGAQVRLLTNFTAAENNGFIGEVGLFNAASGPYMQAVINTAFRKTSQQAVNVYWLITVG